MYESLNEIVTQHSESVGELFSDYGIKAPVSVNSLAAAVHKYGDDFAEDLEHLVLLDFAGFKDKATRQATKAKKKADRDAKRPAKGTGAGTGKSKFVDWIKGSSGDLLGGLVGGITNSIGKGKTPVETTDGGAPASAKPPLTDEEKKAKEQKTFWTIAGIAAGVIALLVIGLLAMSGGKKVV